MQEGWTCPTCKKGNSPWTAACQHCLIVVAPEPYHGMKPSTVPPFETKAKEA